MLGLEDLHRAGFTILWRLFASRSMAGRRFLDRPVKKGEPHSRNSHHTAAVDLDHGYESAVICIFPNRESWTGRAPSGDDIFVAPLAVRQPFEEIQDQVFYRCVAHRPRTLPGTQVATSRSSNLAKPRPLHRTRSKALLLRSTRDLAKRVNRGHYTAPTATCCGRRSANAFQIDTRVSYATKAF